MFGTQIPKVITAIDTQQLSQPGEQYEGRCDPWYQSSCIDDGRRREYSYQRPETGNLEATLLHAPKIHSVSNCLSGRVPGERLPKLDPTMRREDATSSLTKYISSQATQDAPSRWEWRRIGHVACCFSLCRLGLNHLRSANPTGKQQPMSTTGVGLRDC